MPTPEPLNVVEAITEHSDFHTAVFMSYGADLGFYEEAILRSLRSGGCRNHLLLIDAQRYADTINVFRGSFSWTGQRYLLLPVNMGPLKSFHAKLVLLLGSERGRLLVGSGNLTFTGYGRNHELYTCLDWTPDAPECQSLFRNAWELVADIVDNLTTSHSAEEFLEKASIRTRWLIDNTQSDQDLEFWHNREVSMLDQLTEKLSGYSVRKIKIISPFFTTLPLAKIAELMKPESIELVLQDNRSTGDTEQLQKLIDEGVPLKIRRFSDDQRYMHAKAYMFEIGQESFLLTGSPNCTGAALTSDSKSGNLEVGLFRHSSDDGQYFNYLTDGMVDIEPIQSLSEITIRPFDFKQPSEPGEVRLHDISLGGNYFSVSWSAMRIRSGLTKYCLLVVAEVDHLLTLKDSPNQLGDFEARIEVSPAISGSIESPISATIVGIDEVGNKVLLGCNELWVTQLDALRHAVIKSLPNLKTVGNLLTGQLDPTYKEWQEIYSALTSILEFDVERVSQISKLKSGGKTREKKRKQDSSERETEVALIESLEEEYAREEALQTALTYESDPLAILDYVLGRLPGKERAPYQKRDTDDGGEPGDPSKRKTRNWTPDRRLKRRFQNLIRKYIQSLDNPSYMHNMPVLALLTDCTVFQLVIWQLYQKEMLDAQNYIELSNSINQGFFGKPGSDAPIGAKPQLRHIRRRHADLWKDHNVAGFCLASLRACLVVANSVGNTDLTSLITDLETRILTCLAIAVPEYDVSLATPDSVAQQANAFGIDADVLVKRLNNDLRSRARQVTALLDEWTSQAAYIDILDSGVESDEEERRQRERFLRLEAGIDYRLASFSMAQRLRNADRQMELCEELSRYYRLTGKQAEAQKWDETLVTVASEQGSVIDVAKALFEHGSNLFYAGEYEQAVTKLRQALNIAISVDDSDLRARISNRLDHAKYMARPR